MPTNYYMFFVAAVIPLLVGALYYHPKTFGTSWMKVNGFTEESMKKGNMTVVFVITYILSLLLALTMSGVVIHQGGAFQMMMPAVSEVGNPAQAQFNELMVQYGGNFRTFNHGLLHGILAAIFFVLPIVGINALFEKRGWKYILIHVGYWAICLGLMGGLLCQTLQYAPL